MVHCVGNRQRSSSCKDVESVSCVLLPLVQVVGCKVVVVQGEEVRSSERPNRRVPVVVW